MYIEAVVDCVSIHSRANEIYTNIMKRKSLFVCLNAKISGSTGPIYFFLFYMKAAFFAIKYYGVRRS